MTITTLSDTYTDACIYNDTLHIANSSGISSLTGDQRAFTVETGEVFLGIPQYTLEMNVFGTTLPNKVYVKTNEYQDYVEITPESNKIHLPRGLRGSYLAVKIECSGTIQLFEVLTIPSKRNV